MLLNTNALIKKLRIAHGMTQEKLAEGICSRETISKIEKGERKPDWFILQNVLQRLGVNLDELYNDINEFTSEDVAYVVKRYDELKRHFEAFEYEEMKKILDELEKDKRFAESSVKNGGRGYHVFLRFKAALYIAGPYKNLRACVDYAIKCIKLNRPNFDLDKISDYFLSPEELALLSLIAVAYKELHGISKTIEIFHKVKAHYEEQHMINIHNNRRYRELLLNIASALKFAGRHEECLEIAEYGLKYAFIHSEMRACFIYMHHIAWCLMKLDRRSEGEEQYKKCLMFAYVLGSHSVVSFEDAKKDYEEAFGGSINLSLPW